MIFDKYHALDEMMVRDNLLWRQETGRLKGELPHMACVQRMLYHGTLTATPKARDQAIRIINMACKIGAYDTIGEPYDESSIPILQTKAFFLAGGGPIGHTAATQPADFEFDERAGFTTGEAGTAYLITDILVALAKKEGLDPHLLPDPVNIHHMGLFN